MPKGYYKSRRNWTEKEIDFMNDFAGILSIDEMARKLRRTRNAVVLYRTRHKMPYVWDNVYSYSLLAEELNRTRRVLRKWVGRGWLVGRRATYASKFGKKAMLFQYDDIVCFLKEHYELFKDKMPNNVYFRNVVLRRLEKEQEQAKSPVSESARTYAGNGMPLHL